MVLYLMPQVKGLVVDQGADAVLGRGGCGIVKGGILSINGKDERVAVKMFKRAHPIDELMEQMDKYMASEISALLQTQGSSHLMHCYGWDIVDSGDKDLRGRPLMNLRIVMPLMDLSRSEGVEGAITRRSKNNVQGVGRSLLAVVDAVLLLRRLLLLNHRGQDLGRAEVGDMDEAKVGTRPLASN